MDTVINPEVFTSETLFDNLIWISSEDAAKYLRKSIGAIYTLVYRGQLKARKWNRRLYFKRSEIDQMLNNSLKRGG